MRGQDRVLPAPLTLSRFLALPPFADKAAKAIKTAQDTYAAGNPKAATDTLQTGTRSIAIRKGGLLNASPHLTTERTKIKALAR